MAEAPEDERLYEQFLRTAYHDEIKNGDGGFFMHIGLSPDATWEQFRAHYPKDVWRGSEKLMGDLMSYPPSAERWHKAAREEITPEQHFSDILDDIEAYKKAVKKHGKPEDRKALAKLIALRDEILSVGKFRKH